MTSPTISFIILPRDILDSNLLPLLDYFCLARLYQVSKAMRNIVENYLASYSSLDMSLVTRRLQYEDWRKKVPLAFMFLTRGSSSLRRLTVNDVTDIPVASLETLKLVLRKNQNLQFLTLINIKLTSSVMQAILELDHLRVLEISPEICPGVKFTNILEQIQKKGCSVVHHHPG